MAGSLGRALREFAGRRLQGLCGVGLILGTLFFAASVTPTLVPRSSGTQGVLAGVCFAIGYGLGVSARWLWRYLELPRFSDRIRGVGNMLVAASCAAVVLVFLWQAADWQNSVRAVMGMAPVASARPVKLCGIGLLTFVVLLLLARLFRLAAREVARFMRRFIPRRVANVLGVLAATLLFWSLASDVVARRALATLDASYRELDALLDPEQPPPRDPAKTGSAASLVSWEALGRTGRDFVLQGPRAAQIAGFTGRAAREPVRVYVGLRAAGDAQARAQLALRELIRQGGFSRQVLVVVTPTGTGWIDPSAMGALEYLHHGDVASVAVQYSYLSSPLSLLVQPELGAESAAALFTAVYDYWTRLPRDRRPRLYLHGLSLGAMNSERSLDLLQILDDPVAGALWSGPPFRSRAWRSFTEGRRPGTPVWLPEYGDGRLVRFMGQQGSTVPADAPWGPVRIVYLQHASDPIVFFDHRDAWRRPAWMQAPRGPDVSPELRWYPVVTMLQLALDMAVAADTPMGYGHVYAPEDYVDAWVAVSDPQGWPAEALAALREHLALTARRAAGAAG